MKRISASDHEPISKEFEDVMKEKMSQAPYPAFLGMVLEEVRKDYSRMRIRYKPELNQPAGVLHGGAVMSLIDTAVVNAILSGVEQLPDQLLSIDIHTHFLSMVREEDCIAEAEVRHRGRKIVFLNVEVRTASGKLVADGAVSYKVVYPR